VPKQVALASIVVMLGIVVSFVTLIQDYYFFMVLQFIIGVTSGAAINACEAWILEIWQDSCPPYMQALQFFRGLGYILGPIIVEPFLIPEEDEDISPTSKSINQTKISGMVIKIVMNGTESTPSELENYIYIPYMINGLMLVLAAILVFFQYFYTVRKSRSANMMASSQATIISTITCEDKLSQSSDEKNEKESKREEPKLYTFSIIILCSLFYLFFFEEVVVTYLASFSANIDLHLTKSGGAFLTSIFNLCNVMGKGVSIVLALKLNHFTMLYMNLSVILISLVVLIIFSNTSLVMLWFGVCLLGMHSFIA
jgi:hypothetical protein